MAKKKEQFKNDRALRFYYEVLGLERLHYGLWTDEDERSLEGVKTAQKRYEDFLVEKIKKLAPSPVDCSVLDVGCGSGVMSQTLYEKSFEVEGLSPDLYQKEVFEKRIPVPFHLARFQTFTPSKKYDIVLMSESAQYIPMKRLFENAANCLQKQGYLMVCDYFTFDHASGPLAKSGHRLSTFLELAKESGFNLVEDQDITGETIPTLDTARDFAHRYILPSIDIFSEKLTQKYPLLFRASQWLFRKKIRKAWNNLALLDSEEFAKNKSYRYMLFQIGQEGS